MSERRRERIIHLADLGNATGSDEISTQTRFKTKSLSMCLALAKGLRLMSLDLYARS